MRFTRTTLDHMTVFLVAFGYFIGKTERTVGIPRQSCSLQFCVCRRLVFELAIFERCRFDRLVSAHRQRCLASDPVDAV